MKTVILAEPGIGKSYLARKYPDKYSDIDSIGRLYKNTTHYLKFIKTCKNNTNANIDTSKYIIPILTGLEKGKIVFMNRYIKVLKALKLIIPDLRVCFFIWKNVNNDFLTNRYKNRGNNNLLINYFIDNMKTSTNQIKTLDFVKVLDFEKTDTLEQRINEVLLFNNKERKK